MSTNRTLYTVKKLTEADIPMLREATGRDESKRLRQAGRSYHPKNLVMAVKKAGEIVGCVAVLFERPAQWDIDDAPLRLPEFRSLSINEKDRSQGAGSFLIEAVEDVVRICTPTPQRRPHRQPGCAPPVSATWGTSRSQRNPAARFGVTRTPMDRSTKRSDGLSTW